MPARPSSPPSPPTPHRWRHAQIGGVVAAVMVLGGIGVGEWMGWPLLARPVAHQVSLRLHRTVQCQDEAGRAALRLNLLGGVRLQCARLWVAAPAWSDDPDPMLKAEQVDLELRYSDLIAFKRGRPLRIKRLAAHHPDLRLQRLADGRASWQFGDEPPTRRHAPARNPVFDGLRFDELSLAEGQARVRDAVVPLNLVLHLALHQGAGNSTQHGLSATAHGDYRGQPLQASLHTSGDVDTLSHAPQAPALPVQLDLTVGQAALRFDGRVRDPLGQRWIDGRYTLRGPSLFAVGEPLGLTLPTTAPFSMRGQIDHLGVMWHTVVERATVGRSELNGAFRLNRTPDGRPWLTGYLAGAALMLADLGPAVGVPVAGNDAAPAPSGRVLPQREFNLPALRAMNADIAVSLDRLSLGAKALSDIQPMKARLLLKDGVLQLQNIDARMAQGALSGDISLDGRSADARWNTRLRLSGLKLEHWVQSRRAHSAPPYVTGKLGVALALTGQGRSTAELLGSANGRAILHWQDGTLSHLLTELAGLDAAQAIGVWLRGDGALRVDCGAADLTVTDGTIKPRVMLVDSRDSTLWVEGALSLATERLALVARVAPKDVSPLALRSPIHVDGTLRDPVLSVEKGPLLRRLLPAALLAALNPLAALLPLVDTGDEEARKALETCRRVAGKRLD